MLTCIPRSKQQQPSSLEASSRPNLSKSLSSQFKEIITFTAHHRRPEHKRNDAIDSTSFRFGSWSSYGKTTSSKLMSTASGEISVGKGEDEVVFVEERVPREWVALVENGVVITFVSLVDGGNHLKRIRFSKDIFDKTRAQIWWTVNFDRIMELYNVQKLDPQAFPVPTPPSSVNENLNIDVRQEAPATPPLNQEYHPAMSMEKRYSSSDSLDQHSLPQSPRIRDSMGPTTSPKKCSVSKAKTKTSSMNASMSKMTSSTREDSLSVSSASDVESEWVVEDEPGVYITIKALSDGTKELKRVRFRRGKFGEMYARVWWEKNSSRVHKQYL